MTLFDDSKIITTANAAKAGVLYSVKPESGLADLDVTRATTATIVNESGAIESVAVNEPQLDYTDGSCPSFLIEPQRTNLLTYSTGLPSGGWGGNGYIWGTDTAVAPDGTTTGNTIEVQATNSYTFNNFTVDASSQYTFSFYAKRGTATQMKFYAISLDNFTTLISQTDFYPLTNSSTWTRVSATFATDAATTNIRIYYRYVTPAASTFFLWGLQLEKIPNYDAQVDASATSYIPTSGATVTRNQTTFTKSGLSSLMGQTEGTFFLEVDYNYHGAYGFISMGGNSSNQVGIGYTNSSVLWLQLLIGGAGINTFWGLPGYPSGYFKIAGKYKSGDFAVWLNGTEVQTSTSTGTASSTYEKIASAYGVGTIYNPFAKIKQIQVYDRALTDSELLTLTT